jgi:hypothetical protein
LARAVAMKEADLASATTTIIPPMVGMESVRKRKSLALVSAIVKPRLALPELMEKARIDRITVRR